MARNLKRLYGGAATGEYYWPRPDITDPIIDAVTAGESISLFGLRRTGKSSVLLEVQRVLSERGATVKYVDVQGRDRVDRIVSALISAIPATDAGTKFAGALAEPRVSKAIDFVNRLMGRQNSVPASPLEVLHRIELLQGELGSLLAAQTNKIVLIVDELPYLIVHMLDAGVSPNYVNAFLATLRSWRHEGRVTMLFAGSIGLQWLFRERGIARENFNDLVPYTTPPPLGDADARAMLQALAVGENCEWMNEDIVGTILAESAAKYPSFLQFAFGRVKGHGARSVSDVVRVFEDHIRPSLDEDFYDQFDTRLARYDSAANQTARAVLRRIDDDYPDVTPLQTIDSLLSSDDPSLRDHLLLSLVEDGFVRVDTKNRTITFSSPLVQTWWQSKPYRR